MKFSLIPFRRIVTIIICLNTLMVVSCQKDNPIDPPSNVYSNSTLDYIISLGYSNDRIVDVGKYYLVEGDIKFWKDSNHKKARPIQRARISSPLAQLSTVDNITVGITSFPNTAWSQRVIDGTQAAINSWNGLSNCKVNFIYTPGPATPDILIEHDATLPLDAYGSTEVPSTCTASTFIGLNTNSQYLSVDQLHFLIAHELSHTIGFTHTDHQGDGSGVNSFVVRTTPDGDGASVMNSGIYHGVFTNPTSVKKWSDFAGGFSTYDRSASSFLFPNSPDATLTDNGAGLNLVWPPSYFCSSEVIIEVYKNNVQVGANSLEPNTGFFFINLNDPGSYRAEVQDARGGTRTALITL